jgi:hypothetical protein
MISLGELALQADDPALAEVVRLLSAGNADAALDRLSNLPITSDDARASLLKGQILRTLDQKAATHAFSLIWQVHPDCWEGAWIKDLFEASVADQIVDLDHRQTAPQMVVVDNQLDAGKEKYYRQAYEAGCRTVLVHLSDEGYTDSLAAYRWCDVVFRNYWSPFLTVYTDVKFFPLGYKNGFVRTPAVPAPHQRQTLWSFAGDPHKSSRAEMIEAMSSYAPGRLHLTSGFHAADNLPTVEYQNMMLDSVFVPCPKGNINLDSFRVYETLECGAIPIVESTPTFDYFRALFGDHPLPTIQTWADVGPLIQGWLSDDGGFRLQRKCQEWWFTQKETVRRDIRTSIDRLVWPNGA